MTNRWTLRLSCHDLLLPPLKCMNSCFKWHFRTAAAQPDCGWQGSAVTEDNVAWSSSYFDRILKISAPSVKLLLYKFCQVWSPQRNICQIESSSAECHLKLRERRNFRTQVWNLFNFFEIMYIISISHHIIPYIISPKLNDIFNSTIKVELYFQLFPVMCSKKFEVIAIFTTEYIDGKTNSSE